MKKLIIISAVALLVAQNANASLNKELLEEGHEKKISKVEAFVGVKLTCDLRGTLDELRTVILKTKDFLSQFKQVVLFSSLLKLENESLGLKIFRGINLDTYTEDELNLAIAGEIDPANPLELKVARYLVNVKKSHFMADIKKADIKTGYNTICEDWGFVKGPANFDKFLSYDGTNFGGTVAINTRSVCAGVILDLLERAKDLNVSFDQKTFRQRWLFHQGFLDINIPDHINGQQYHDSVEDLKLKFPSQCADFVKNFEFE